MPIKVKAVGKPNMIATTTKASINSPKWPLAIWEGAGSKIKADNTTKAMIVRPNQISFFII